MEYRNRIQSLDFFRRTLLRLTTEEHIRRFLDKYEAGQKAMRTQIVEIMWYMRGSLGREDAWRLSPIERMEIMEMVQERIKLVKETKLPLL